MRAFKVVLRLMGGTIILISLMHVALGPYADLMLGAEVSSASLRDPTMDSQYRFYGMAFSLFGAVFLVSSGDVVRYTRLLNVTFLVFFLGGLARLLSLLAVGLPGPAVLALIIVELVVPVLLALWLRQLAASPSEDL